jgi:hypothetical protein
MIRLSIAGLIFFYTLFSAIIILVIWAVSGYRRPIRPGSSDTENVWKCAVCFHSYIDSRHDEMSACPLCGSYNKRDRSKRGIPGGAA